MLRRFSPFPFIAAFFLMIVGRLDAEGRAAYDVRPMPMTREAWFIVVSYGVLHILLIYGVWRLRPSRLQKLKT